MKPQLILIDSIDGLLDLGEYLADKDIIAFDVETTGLSARDQIIGYSVCAAEDKAYYIILAQWQYGQLVWNPLVNATKALMGFLQTKSLIMHNGVYDCMMVESNFKVSLINSLHTDTMVLAHLLNENRKIGLKELAKEYYGEDSTQESKEMQASVLANGGVWSAKNKEMFKANSEILAKYGAKDAWLTYMLFQELVIELDAQGLYDFFYLQESMPLLRTSTYELNTVGIQVDTTALLALKKTLQAECAEAKAFIHKEIAAKVKDKYPGTAIKNTFNIGSNQQMSWLLFGEYGLEFGNLTKVGKAVCKHFTGGRLPYTYAARKDFIHNCLTNVGNTYEPEARISGKVKKAKKIAEPWKYLEVNKKTLAKIAPKLEWVKRLLEYQTKTKLLNTYVKSIETKVQYGVLHPSYLQSGTKTGRYASRLPNLQNLPRNDQRIKDCFVARPGKVFVSADFSQLEPRTFASYSKEPKLMAAFDGATDFYSVVGMEIFDKSDCTPQKDGSEDAFGVKYKKLRDLTKTIALAAAYGATPNQLAPTTGKSIEDTASDMEKYFEHFPGVKSMMIEAHDIAKKKGQVTSLFGRPRRLPDAKMITKAYGKSPHADLPYEARNVLNMACNFRIQSTGASIVNRAAIAFHFACKEAGIDCKLVQQCHDELVVECLEKDAGAVSTLLQYSMEQTTLLPGVALEAIPRTTRTLAK